MPVGAGVEVVAAVVAVHEVDAAGDRADVVDDGLQRVAAGVGVAGVEAESDHRPTPMPRQIASKTPAIRSR